MTRPALLRSLSLGTRLFIVCSLFVVALGVAAYEFIVDRPITIDLARKEFIANDRLAQQRIADQVARLNVGLAVVAGLACAGLFLGAMTCRRVMRVLQQLEDVIGKIRETSNYDLRMDQSGKDEIGKLGTAFNDMVSQFADTQARESMALLDLAQIGRSAVASVTSAAIAHEINQPLAAIAANANAGLRWLERPVPEIHEVREALNWIVRDALAASQQMDHLRAIFKKVEGERAPVSMNEVVNEALSLIHGWLDSRRVFVSSHLQSGLPQVLGDRAQLQQVILNLVMNGAEAMDLVSDRTRLLEITSMIQAPSDIEITLQDNGAGVEPSNMSEIFEAFFTTKPGAIGMGLCVCRSIIDSHGGRLWASAAEPHGTVFHLLLPGIDPAGGQ